MRLQAILFGPGTLINASEIEREAYNRVFAEAGLPWVWDASHYERLSRISGAAGVLETFVRTERPGWRYTEDLQHLLRAARRRQAAIAGELMGDPRFLDESMVKLAQACAAAGLRLVTLAPLEPPPSGLPQMITAESHEQALTALNLRGYACLAIESSQDGLEAAASLGIAAAHKSAVAAKASFGPADLHDLHAQYSPKFSLAHTGLRSLAMIA